ncbi:MAG: prephenate dehydratase [Thermodesulfobacteriota bacterium]|nr:prephenate dehydratase [Thermodesulfobacteriota bacterium]
MRHADSHINELRKSIDEIDEKILDLINQRLLLGKEIGAIKRKNNEPVTDKAREMAIITRLKEINQGHLRNDTLEHIFTQIIAESREIQQPQKISYLGPEATFTHIAAMNHFGLNVSYMSQPAIYDVFSEVEKGLCAYGVVPVENSNEGSVNHTLDLFFESDLKICAEIFQPISHDLLSRTKTIDEIKVIYSHSHAFAQCRNWIRSHLPTADHKECNSTAQAAKKATETIGSAAIGARAAAHLYNLEVAATRIENNDRNITRFLVIGKDKTDPTENDKTSIMFATAHVPGALYKALQPLDEAGINMVKLESRPAKHENWRYFFFVDFQGHIRDPVVHQTITRMKKLCLHLKHLGSYPMAKP